MVIGKRMTHTVMQRIRQMYIFDLSMRSRKSFTQKIESVGRRCFD